MKQKVVDDDGNVIGWFDDDEAQMFEEDTWFNGSNRISRATGSQWDHERLYLTEDKNWIKHWWSQWQGSVPRYEQISENEAREWFLKNEMWTELEELGMNLDENKL